MKITQAAIAGKLERPEIFLRHYGRLYAVTALTTSMDEANAHMAANHRNEGLLAEHGGFCFVVKMSDSGTPRPPEADAMAMETIRGLLDGKERNTETCEAIAQILRRQGLAVRDAQDEGAKYFAGLSTPQIAARLAELRRVLADDPSLTSVTDADEFRRELRALTLVSP